MHWHSLRLSDGNFLLCECDLHQLTHCWGFSWAKRFGGQNSQCKNTNWIEICTNKYSSLHDLYILTLTGTNGSIQKGSSAKFPTAQCASWWRSHSQRRKFPSESRKLRQCMHNYHRQDLDTIIFPSFFSSSFGPGLALLLPPHSVWFCLILFHFQILDNKVTFILSAQMMSVIEFHHKRNHWLFLTSI